MKYMRYIFCLGLSLCLSACATLSLEPLTPEISLMDIKVTQLGFFEQTFALQLQVKNPNDFPLPITGLQYKLEINGSEFATGNSGTSTLIPSLGSKLMTVEVVSNLNQIVAQIKDWSKGLSQTVDYRLSGGIRLSDWMPLLPFERAGQVPLTIKR
ncbi:LEA type 2 family protein [Beggiatoa leptomitoformis]|uniref:Water stress and hypersensitive response domain-containing protein n=1 Tax=Beggiatoa leptomitoformis TaxID=288004 RepID=A0A2N9YG17_9GAMM|nr:LEA type 2 family protein [Beggiatoa leptomitoformis]ALG68241.1 hypothetical protein AL038_11625 [Beggiatoa leptomitoformis]AUI69452.1 hypothetical protein BLE401_12650 [Beggiatoa leptomitoformis]